MTSLPNEPIKVGVLFSSSGVTAPIELSQQRATILAAEEINHAGGINGRELQLVFRDPASTPARYAALIEQLIVEEQIRVVVGCYMSSTRKAVIPIVERHNALLFYPTLYEGFEYSRNVIYTGAAPNQNSLPLADYMLGHFGSRVFMVGSDYIYPYESNRIMSDLVFERGGEKLEEIYLPLDAGWSSYLSVAKKIAAQAPDFVFSTVVGSGISHMYRAFAEAGLDPYKTPIASLTTSETEVAAMGAALGEGHITAATYFQSVSDPVNQRCLANYHQRFGSGVVTDMCWEAAYFQMHVLANAMRITGGDDTNALLKTLPGLELNAPQGRIRIDEHNHHTYLHPRIGRLNRHGQFDILSDSPGWTRADPFVISHSLVDEAESHGGPDEVRS
ncbi:MULTISPECIES: transporter substrate-binding domain-containing protein [Paraburkholderia]|uniref:transporter substrate-binding domain-containing protein n=1 Tax=Paraburkholderia TaxID=1822464 RepID=UPI00225AD6D5|nr:MULTISPECIES: transporter substrate-binding domain-containing protein [Paraburkholderia]MCX4157739.1 transporter substrate-binding domain-containing protein [Paraburkholderia aspalathi]MDN7167141.1 transporter substrate-binding domain-containing protein [Paraburkholderia sp. SECH2]MDQ6395629.1 transporter substrate-binding domain-containing protein [Paraburkholderia aspalathi]